MRAGLSRMALRTGAWAAVGVIGLGAAAGVAAATGGSSGPPAPAPGTATVAAADPDAAASAAPQGMGRHRFGLLRRAVHGTVVVRTRDGFLTVAFQRGTVQSVTGNTVRVVSADHFTATYTVGPQSRVMKDRRPVTLSSVRAGDHVLVVASQSGSGWTVRRLMDRGTAPLRTGNAVGPTA